MAKSSGNASSVWFVILVLAFVGILFAFGLSINLSVSFGG